MTKPPKPEIIILPGADFRKKILKMRQVIYAKSPPKIEMAGAGVTKKSRLCFLPILRSLVCHTLAFMSAAAVLIVSGVFRARLPSFLIGCCSSSCAVGLTPDAVSLMNSTLNADVQPLVPPDCFCVR